MAVSGPAQKERMNKKSPENRSGSPNGGKGCEKKERQGSPIEDRGWKSQPKNEGTQYEKGARGSAKKNKHNKKQSSYV
eukprot:SM000010S04367  [mRNA]  locus=s10:1092970:1093216:+ [translate_table: standard]